MHTVCGAVGKTPLWVGTPGLMPLSLPVHLCWTTLSMVGVLAQSSEPHGETCLGREKRERERIPACTASQASSCLEAVVQFTIAVPPDQAGHQPVPGPRDGAAGQRAEWAGLSHSEAQVTLTQETSPRVPTCLLGCGDSYAPILLFALASGTFKRRCL